MDCGAARDWIFRLLDGELSGADEEVLRAHVESCAGCGRDLRLLSLPRRLARTLPILEPSPFFYQKLRAHLDRTEEAQNVTVWQIVLGLSRQIVPALASVTVVLVSVFIYTQIRGPQIDYQAYDSIFLSGDRPNMAITAQGDVSDESVLRAIVEEDPDGIPDSNDSSEKN